MALLLPSVGSLAAHRRLGGISGTRLAAPSNGTASKARALSNLWWPTSPDWPFESGKWLPGLKTPPYLDGLPASHGFDPLGLGREAESLRWYRQSEVYHCRTTMTAVVGILLPAITTKLGITNYPQWYEAGKVQQESSPYAFSSILVVEFYLYGFVECKRWADFAKPGSQAEKGTFFGVEETFGGNSPANDESRSYPGGLFFDPLNLGSAPEPVVARRKIREIKNGRLAMLALLGFTAQYIATGKGPIDNLVDHVSNPWENNVITNGFSIPSLPDGLK